MFVVVLVVLENAKPDLLHIGRAGDLPGLLANGLENWEQDSCENRDNSNHDEQLDQRKAAFHQFFHLNAFHCISMLHSNRK